MTAGLQIFGVGPSQATDAEVSSAVADHVNDATSAHLAAAIGYDPTATSGSGINDTDVQGAIEQIVTVLGGAVATLFSAKQDADADLTALAALTTTAYGRALLELADAAAGRTALGVPATAAVLAVASNLSDVANAATAFANIKQAATTSATGVSELATDAEAIAAADTARVLTPSNLAALTEASLAAVFASPSWTTVGSGGGAPAFSNGWVAGSTALKYTKIRGVVFVSGLADCTDATNNAVFTLPAGYRPNTDQHRATVAFGSARAVTFIDVQETGVVELFPGLSVDDLDTANTENVSFDMCFPAEA